MAEAGKKTGRITTHVLDTTLGEPARGMGLALYRVCGEAAELVTLSVTNADGRVDSPLLEGDALTAGVYEIRFKAGEYMVRQGRYSATQTIWDLIPIRFKVVDPNKHYHVPLLLSPGGYSTYRGS
ncbi:hydroxyisourate hydrolase [Paenibacillus sp. LHD-117]|uniref:hydroxyisourate hydrolase n=1 Tax=Paenibacillus sp. LHD-117 TaxID=3071412 RepID=UPI0027DF3A32|nr:hydroxyisourate hydrolase [Paenibacillus sp. LHD-117]MDQ6419141.1 hydroxyisourate hydrolase [Paenibacillus sp. LHD-117]